MPNITITELDLTTPGVASESTDIVYIPGFVNPSQATIKKGKPELFTSVASFITKCGKEPYKFKTAQTVASLATSATNKGFSDEAKAGVENILEMGAYDPAYCMAKELLAAGLSVMFERVNDDTKYDYKEVTDADVIGKEADATSKYFYKDENSNYKPYSEPTISIDEDDGTENVEFRPYDKGNTYEKVETAESITTMYDYLESDAFDVSRYDGIVDKGNYSVKYLTSGGYPVFEYNGGTIVTAMLNMAETRGDCVALIDHIDNPERTINPTEDGSLYKALQKETISNGDFGAMFTPWATYNRATSDENSSGERRKSQLRAPGSYAYLMALADSIKTNANWLAVAGATRGGVRNLASGGMDVIIPNAVADAMQPRSNATAINAITNINPYGLTIWGNRTLKKVEKNLGATDFLNIRNLISDIKKTCYRAARKATFEQDTDILWINFKTEIAQLLDRMQFGYGISGYKVERDYDHEKAAENATLCAKVTIYPTYAVEDFYITVVLQDDGATVN